MKSTRLRAQTPKIDCSVCEKPIAPTHVKKYDSEGKGPMHEACYLTQRSKADPRGAELDAELSEDGNIERVP